MIDVGGVQAVDPGVLSNAEQNPAAYHALGLGLDAEPVGTP